ncbi:MAG: response regulator [Candidatus Solibacter usitatus]|nr:response regulator [Candidatus Solibacter usitatus]
MTRKDSLPALDGFVDEVEGCLCKLSEIFAQYQVRPDHAAVLEDARRAVQRVRQGTATLETLDEPVCDPDLWEAFREEAAELCAQISDCLSSMESGIGTEALAPLRRAVHQLKGASGMAGLMATSRLNAWMQRMLDGVLEGERIWDRAFLPLLRDTFDIVVQSIEGGGKGGLLAGRAEEAEAIWRELFRDDAEPAAYDAGPHDQLEADAELWEAFQQEADEHLRNSGELLRALQTGDAGGDTVPSLRRSIHTFKGASGVVGLALTSHLAHRMEDLLDALQEGRLNNGDGSMQLLLSSHDILVDSLASRGLAGERAEMLPMLLAGYDSFLGQEKARVPWELVTSNAHSVETVAKIQSYVRTPVERVDELVRLASELVIHRSRLGQHLAAYRRENAELKMSVGRLRRIAGKLQSEYETEALRQETLKPEPEDAAGFDSLEMDRYTEFHLLSRDLAETTADLGGTGSHLEDLGLEFEGFERKLRTLAGDVEKRLLQLRMVPLRTLSDRLHRTVRVTCEKRAKDAELLIEGENAELDKAMLDEIAGPLEHLLRNAVDHGLEPAPQRTAAGKPERGTVRIKASNEGAQVVLHICDDGAGIGTDRLRRKAIARGYLAAEEADRMTDQDLFQFIFLPGFSTNAEVNEISGRGVGLDVVRQTVSRLNGTVSVSSLPGIGTTFTIRLPLTLALSRVILVKCGTETYAIPLTAVSQVVRLEPEQLERGGRRMFLRMGPTTIRAIHLTEVVGIPAADANDGKWKALLLHAGNRSMALLVDDVLEAREVVVKPIGAILGHVPGVSGATILGNGSVVLILNPNHILDERLTLSRPLYVMEPRTAAVRQLSVLIVDDSPTVRRALVNLAASAGWISHAAKDGLEAVEMLHGGSVEPDVILTDIEMPRMDGFDLVSSVRGMKQYKRTPVVMLTSRAGEKHRKRARELGVDAYLVKPFQDEELIQTVRRLVPQAPEGNA